MTTHTPQYTNLNNMDFLNFQGDNIYASNDRNEENYNFLGICFGGQQCIAKRDANKEYKQVKRDAKIEGKQADSLLTRSVADLASQNSNTSSGDNTGLYIGLGLGGLVLVGTIIFVATRSKAVPVPIK